MKKDTSQIRNNRFACCYIGYEEEEIIGFCLFQHCQNTAAFCIQYITTDYSNIHDLHQDQYCKSIRKIMAFLQKCIKDHNDSEEDYKVLRFQLTKWENRIKKFISYNSTQLISKLEKINVKIQQIYLKLIQKKQLLDKLFQAIQLQNYEQFRNNLSFVKKCYIQKQDYKIFHSIATKFDNKQRKMQEKLLDSKLQSLIESAASLYLERGKIQIQFE